jgi:ribose transport system permease protein
MTELIAMTSGKDGSSADQSKATYSIKNVSQETLVLATTIVIFILCAIFIRGFFTLANISTLARTVSVLGILGVGMTVVVIGRGLDLSQVAVLAIAAAWSLKLIGLGFGLTAGLALGLGFAIAIGIFNGFAISIVGIPALFTTLASGTLVYGIGRWFDVERDHYLCAGQPAAASCNWSG